MDKWHVFPQDKPTIVAVNYVASNDARDLQYRHQGRLAIIGESIASFSTELAKAACEDKDFIFSIPHERHGSFHSPESGLKEHLHRACVWSMSELEWAQDLLRSSVGIDAPVLMEH